MNLISRDELKAKLDRGDDFKLVMVLGDWHFRAKHIPGSVNIVSPDDPRVADLKKDDEIVVYCSDPNCAASQYAHQLMEREGYTNVRRYAGGISDWEDAGLPLEGEFV